jgi:hypothetical protein
VANITGNFAVDHVLKQRHDLWDTMQINLLDAQKAHTQSFYLIVIHVLKKEE